MSFSAPLNQILLVRDIFIVLLLPSPVEFPIVKKKAEALNKLGKQFPRERGVGWWGLWSSQTRRLNQKNQHQPPSLPCHDIISASPSPVSLWSRLPNSLARMLMFLKRAGRLNPTLRDKKITALGSGEVPSLSLQRFHVLWYNLTLPARTAPEIR